MELLNCDLKMGSAFYLNKSEALKSTRIITSNKGDPRELRLKNGFRFFILTKYKTRKNLYLPRILPLNKYCAYRHYQHYCLCGMRNMRNGLAKQ